MKTELTISKKTFVNEAKEEIEYNSFEFTIDGKTFSLFPRKEDKKLINYILENLHSHTA